MKMFGFRSKNEVGTEIKRLRSLLEKNAEDSKSRLTLADFCLKAGDQETAISEYYVVAKQLSTEGLDLELIAVYRKILDIQAMSLTERSLSVVQEAEDLLVKARRAYEVILQIGPPDAGIIAALGSFQQEEIQTKEESEEVVTLGTDDSEPIPIEMLLDPSEDHQISEIPPNQNLEENLPKEQSAPPVASPPIASRESDRDAGEEPAESLDLLSFSLDNALEEMGVQDAVHEDEIMPEPDSSYRKDRQKTDISDSQREDHPETILADHETGPPTDDSLPEDTPLDPADEDLIDTLRKQLEEVKAKRDLTATPPLRQSGREENRSTQTSESDLVE
jgi:hypothetical protein